MPAVLLLWTGMLWPRTAAGADAAKKVHVVAYINQSSGCQKETEDFLNQLPAKYPGRVEVEFVDIGGKGRDRWKQDGLHCMAIRLNGNSACEVVDRGTTIPVRFEMPPGFQWVHADLGLAVRQMLQGVSAQDRKGPVAVTRPDGGRTVLLIGDQPVIGLPQADRVTAVAQALTTMQPPLSQNDFAMQASLSKGTVMARDKVLLEFTRTDADPLGVSVPELTVRCMEALTEPYPQPVRPFPGRAAPVGR